MLRLLRQGDRESRREPARSIRVLDGACLVLELVCLAVRNQL